MTWRTATSTFDTSGYSAFQSAWVDADTGRITSFNDDGNQQVIKYLKNDFTSVGYKKIISPYMYLTKSNYPSNDDIFSTNTKAFTEVTASGIASDHSFMPYSKGSIFKGKLYANAIKLSWGLGYIYRSTDNGASFTKVCDGYFGNEDGQYVQTENYLWYAGFDESGVLPLLRSSDGLTWTATGYIFSGPSPNRIIEIEGKIVMIFYESQGLYVSSDNGATFDYYAIGEYYGSTTKILHMEKRLNKIYLLLDHLNYGSHTLISAYIDSVPASQDWIYNSVNISYDYSETPPTITTRFASNNTSSVLIFEDASYVKAYSFPNLSEIVSDTLGNNLSPFLIGDEIFILKNNGTTNTVYNFSGSDVTSDFTLPPSMASPAVFFLGNK